MSVGYEYRLIRKVYQGVSGVKMCNECMIQMQGVGKGCVGVISSVGVMNES